MRERINSIIERTREIWASASRRARIILLCSVGAAFALAIVLTVVFNQARYVSLYYDLNQADNAHVIALLNDAGIPYQVDGGRVLVSESDEGRARLMLAVQGFENPGFGYEQQNSGGLTATQQDKNRREIQGLQDRLQATIELFPEVTKAVVTISMPERTMFALQNNETPVSASITITKRLGRSLSQEQVQGIINIVKDSVQGLAEENISIVDSESGDLKLLLSQEGDMQSKKLELTQMVSNSLRDHITRVVQPAYGSDNVAIEVVATLNTDSSVRESITYQPIDPNNPQNNPLDYSEHEREQTGGEFPIVGGVPGAQDNVGTPQYVAEEGEAGDVSYYSSHDIYDYLVGSLREQITKDGFVVERASASILINATALREGERDSIIALASNASGIPSENITVQNIPFYVRDIIPTPITQDLGRLLIISGLGFLALCILLLVILTALSRRKKARLAAEAAAMDEESDYDENGVSLMGYLEGAEEEEFEPIALQESTEQRLKMQIKDLAESDPEIVAQLVKTWLLSSS
ncbi:MAG: flagellar M-ring protein FliF [Oscillospiraceae bacterium]|nr:flagellar M-ring protein FliF [Oscillospiraceae bacterium]